MRVRVQGAVRNEGRGKDSKLAGHGRYLILSKAVVMGLFPRLEGEGTRTGRVAPKALSHGFGRKARQYSDETTTRRHTNNFVSDTLHNQISVHLFIHNIHYRQPWTRT